VDRSAARAIVGRVHADDVAEGPAEGAEAGEPDVHADVGDAAARLAQQEHGALHAPALEVAVGRLAESGAKRADEVRLGDARDLGQGGDVEGLGVGAVDRVAGAEHAPVPLLDGPAHRGPFCRLTPRWVTRASAETAR